MKRQQVSYVICALMGGLGNQMFQYAAARLLAQRMGMPVLVETSFFDGRQRPGKFREHLRDVELFNFRLNKDVTAQRSGLMSTLARQLARRKMTSQIWNFGARFSGIGILRDDCILDHRGCEDCRRILTYGYWTDYRYAEEIRSILLEEYFPRSELISKRAEQVVRAAGKGQPAISLHVRRGDYTVAGSGFSSVPLATIRRQLDYFDKNWPVVVLSDDREWCRSIFNEPRFTVHGGESAIEDLFVMAHADHHVIANSTFSWWGAWLNPKKGKRVIMPPRWFADQGRAWKKMLVPPGWEICSE